MRGPSAPPPDVPSRRPASRGSSFGGPLGWAGAMVRLARRGRPVLARTGVRPARDDGCGADAGGVPRGHPERRPETGTVDALGPQTAFLPRALRVDEVAPHHGWVLRHPLVLGGRSPMGRAHAHHCPLYRPLRLPATSCARRRSNVPAPDRNPPPACPPRQGKTGARRFSGSPPQAEAHRAPASWRTQAYPLAVARGALTASRRSRTCRRVGQRCPGWVHRAATQRWTSTPPGPDRVERGRTGLSPRPWSRSGVHLRGPATRGVGDGGGTRRSPSAPYPGGDAPRARAAPWLSAASCPPATRRGGLRSPGAAGERRAVADTGTGGRGAHSPAV